MKSPEQIFEEGKRLRRKRNEYKIALAELRRTTGKNRWGGFGYILIAGLLGWCGHDLFMSPEPMTKSDGFSQLVFALVIFNQLHAGISQLCQDPKDTALLYLIDEKLEEYEKELTNRWN
ncbi:MAG: hypothetical protein NTV80_08650 [Verrucomicrobia bacterium]|nr:hypothetical protein [Verrucomicrobiota bacterium]